MSKIKIEAVAKPGSEEYLLMLLASDASTMENGYVTIEAIETYLDMNPDEADFFDSEIVLRVKRKIQMVEEAMSAIQIRKSLDRDIPQKLLS